MTNQYEYIWSVIQICFVEQQGWSTHQSILFYSINHQTKLTLKEHLKVTSSDQIPTCIHFRICREQCEVQLLVLKIQPKYSPVPSEQAETSSCALHGKMGGCKEHTKKPHHNNR